MNEKQSQNLLLKVDPFSAIRNNELITQDEELETSAKLSFCIEYIVAACFCFSYFVAFRTMEHMKTYESEE